MSHSNKAGAPGPPEFAGFLQSIVQLDVLENITDNLNTELANSQRVMMDIKSFFDSIPASIKTTEVSDDNQLRHKDISQFLDADVPNLLLSDMTEKNCDVDLDNVIKAIEAMKHYAEDLKKNFIKSNKQEIIPKKEFNNLDLQQYAISLDQLSKRLVNIKLNKKYDTDNKNPELEAKLSQLCDDVNLFTQMVQAKSMVGECNKNWPDVKEDENNALYYDNIINKLLSGINEVSYLLQSNN